MKTAITFLLVNIILGHINALNNIPFYLQEKRLKLLFFYNKLFTQVKEVKFIEFVELCFI